MNRTLVALPLGLIVLLSACAAGSGPGSGSSGSPAPSTGDRIEHDEAATDLIVRMESAGGFVPREFVLGSVPSFSLFGDGRVIMQGAQTLIYPGPLLPSLQERRLTEEGIQAVLQYISDTGMFTESADYQGAAQFVADAPTTVFDVHAGGREVTVSVYGLGIVIQGQGGPELSAVEARAHERLQQLSERLGMLETWLPAEAWEQAEPAEYRPEALRVYARNADADEHDASLGEPQVLSWPLDVPLAEFGEQGAPGQEDMRCGTVSGEEAATLYEELQDATQLTQWRSGESVYALIVRPLLPDEEVACP